jgi:hypothetical protein
MDGITLIALIITIIVMLILAAVVIAIVVDGGLFEQADKAAEKTKQAMIKEQLAIWKAEQLSEKYSSVSGRSFADFLDDLVEQNIITQPERDAIWTDVTEEDGIVSIGGEEIDFNPVTEIEADVTAPTATLSYSNTNATNAPVTVTMTTSEEIVTPNGWAKVDSTHYTRTFTINTSETIEIADLAGNTQQVEITIANIDTTNPNGNVSYSTNNWTNGNITVTMETNKAITTPSGWTKVDNTHYTKVYSANMTENVTITDSASNTGTVSVAVTKIDKTAPTVNAPTTSGVGSSSFTVNVSGGDGSGSGISLYTIEYKKSTDATYTVATATTTSKTITGLTSSTTYNVRVKITDVAGNTSAYSTEVNATTTSGGFYGSGSALQIP